MDQELKNRILNNVFVDDLLGDKVNTAAFLDLCAALNDLAPLWRHQPLVEKDVVLDLYTAVSVIRNKIVEFREKNFLAKVAELENMFIELDRLVSEECLYSSPQ